MKKVTQRDFENLSQCLADKGVPHWCFEILADLHQMAFSPLKGKEVNSFYTLTENGDYGPLPIKTVLEKLTDDFIDDQITAENISELRDILKEMM